MNLSIDAATMEPSHCSVQHMQHIMAKAPKDVTEAQHLLEHIAIIVEKELSKGAVGAAPESERINSVTLNLCFRSFNALLERFNLCDKRFVIAVNDRMEEEAGFLMLNAILSTDYSKYLDAEQFKDNCLKALHKAIADNASDASLIIVRSLNLLCRKFPKLDMNVTLERIYFLLQCEVNGVREETLTLFSYCVRDAECAAKYFALITKHWSWSNKNKYYLLSCILNKHLLHAEYLHPQSIAAEQLFFDGLRLALNHKRLFAASQQLIKSLSAQESPQLLEMCVNILTMGTRNEICNFNAQWFGRIAQKDALFVRLQQQLQMDNIAWQSFNNRLDTSEGKEHQYRLVLIFNMFSRHIFELSKLLFFRVSTELITNCFEFEAELQLMIFQFVVDNLSKFAIEDCLDFLLRFINAHKSAATAQYRNCILSQMPTVINYISKTYCRVADSNVGDFLCNDISNFFGELQRSALADIESSLYQQKIFALRLLEILISSLCLKTLFKNAKNCNVAQNHRLGTFLCKAQQEQQCAFDVVAMSERLLALLSDPQGYDDVQAIVIKLLQQLQYDGDVKVVELCAQMLLRCDLNACKRSALYAAVAVNCSNTAATKLFHICYEFLSDEQHFQHFIADPLLICESKYHLFGFLEVLDVCPTKMQSQFKQIINIVNDILKAILRMLNRSMLQSNGIDSAANVANAASFQEMSQSLALLVTQSAFTEHTKVEQITEFVLNPNEEQMSKFLLKSFWYTLKACCDLATTIGCHLLATSESNASDLELLQQCLQINVDVLMKCRHKGAIEAAGLSIGKLTKCLTQAMPATSQSYRLLYNCIDLLLHFDNVPQTSITRRGAGLSIMFLHLIKNEQKRTRPLHQYALERILGRLSGATSQSSAMTVASNATFGVCYDSIEALILHYLCVLVKNTELRSDLCRHYDRIMLAAIEQIDNAAAEWTVCNAALQLFGALVPKIVGQKNEMNIWESNELTFEEIAIMLPQTCAYILRYCAACERDISSDGIASVRSIVLFLSFLSKVEHLQKRSSEVDAAATVIMWSGCEFVERLRPLLWSLLAHRAHKVRQLAAICFVRAHEFRCELPSLLLELSKLLFEMSDENFFESLILVLIEGVHKIQYESLHIIDQLTIANLFNNIKSNLTKNFQIHKHNLYTLSKLFELMRDLGFEEHSKEMRTLINLDISVYSCIGKDIFVNAIKTRKM